MDQRSDTRIAIALRVIKSCSQLVHRQLKELRELEWYQSVQRPERLCGIRLTRKLWYLPTIIESRAPGGGDSNRHRYLRGPDMDQRG